MSVFEILKSASIPKEYKNFGDLTIGEYPIVLTNFNCTKQN